jgi:hypothetical protein
MHERNFTNPPVQPQGEYGGVSAVLGGAIIFFVVCVVLLHMAFVAREHSAARTMIRIEAAIFASLAAIGCVLAILGLKQRNRRHSAAVVGLLINTAVLLVSTLVFLVM